MSTESMVSRFRELSSNDKIRLVQDLWDEIADEAARIPLSESRLRLLDERIADAERNPDDARTLGKSSSLKSTSRWNALKQTPHNTKRYTAKSGMPGRSGQRGSQDDVRS